ncbi:innexin [Trichonephila clavipes]|nr:innexin [Trichonephila clavipes]
MISIRGYHPYVMWSAFSPDFNPIKHIWDMFGRKVADSKLPPTCVPELRRALFAVVFMTLQVEREKMKVPEEVPHPGIASSRDPRDYFHLRYYQWVYIMLFLQAFLFYIPRWLWKQWEGRKMEILTKDMGKVLLPEPQLNQKFNALSGYLNDLDITATPQDRIFCRVTFLFFQWWSPCTKFGGTKFSGPMQQWDTPPHDNAASMGIIMYNNNSLLVHIQATITAER